MSRPRLLTDPDDVAASDEFKRCLIASKKTQEQVAAEIGSGVSQGTVWQWANRRLAIPANRAADAARAVGTTPDKISTEHRRFWAKASAWIDEAPHHYRGPMPTSGYEPAPDLGPSQHVGIALSTVADAMIVIRAYLEDKGEPVENLPDPVLVKAALDLVVERAEPLTLTNVIAFKRQLATRLKETDNGDERREAAGAG
ncbi:hypothetical protein [Lysobacter auxotrophicus]|uniref:XRE family transcriptional regulator n=1 Tax=Lysobacter auxotrophicus TaxID=2992573 RepID=A0ABM8DG15_9GAMM|nr:hypothetical protein [Lysobacter auxotrophicus]BDU17551.1 hypothetical protein LA521A_27520 [Lysobacter auxotrophicus]